MNKRRNEWKNDKTYERQERVGGKSGGIRGGTSGGTNGGMRGMSRGTNGGMRATCGGTSKSNEWRNVQEDLVEERVE